MKYTLEEAKKILKKKNKVKKLAKKQKALQKGEGKLKEREIYDLARRIDSAVLGEELTWKEIRRESESYSYYLQGVLNTLKALGYDECWVNTDFKDILDDLYYLPLQYAIATKKYEMEEVDEIPFVSTQVPINYDDLSDESRTLTQEELEELVRNSKREEYPDTGFLEEVEE